MALSFLSKLDKKLAAAIALMDAFGKVKYAEKLTSLLNANTPKGQLILMILSNDHPDQDWLWDKLIDRVTINTSSPTITGSKELLNFLTKSLQSEDSISKQKEPLVKTSVKKTPKKVPNSRPSQVSAD